jgi:hypothetical protein
MRTCPVVQLATLHALGGVLLQPSAPVAPISGTMKARMAILDSTDLLSLGKIPFFFLLLHVVLQKVGENRPILRLD